MSDAGGQPDGVLAKLLRPLAAPFEAVPPLRISLATGRHFHRTHCGARAAEIAYWSILSSIPFGALLLMGLGLVISRLLASGWSREELHSTLADMASTYLPDAIPDMEATIGWLLGGQQTLGVVGVIALFVTASLVFGAISRALAAIFERPTRDRYTTTALFTAGLCALALLGAILIPLLSVFEPLMAPIDMAFVAPMRLHALSGALLGLTFLFLLTTVARAAVPWRLALMGAGIYLALFEMVRWGFSIYLASLSKMHLIYGSLVGVMALFIWSYVAAFVLLLTMCLMRVLRDGLHQTSLGRLLGEG